MAGKVNFILVFYRKIIILIKNVNMDPAVSGRIGYDLK